MASSGKRKTTMAKLARESRLRERRLEKQAKKAARKLAFGDSAERRADTDNDRSSRLDAEPSALEATGQTLRDDA